MAPSIPLARRDKVDKLRSVNAHRIRHDRLCQQPAELALRLTGIWTQPGYCMIHEKLSDMLWKVKYWPVNPDTILVKILFEFFSLLSRAGIVKPNEKIQYIRNENKVLILTPLAGSSSVVAAYSGEIYKHQITKHFNTEGIQVFILDRDYNARLNSFYNKKVRNPTNISKLFLLATCYPLTVKSSSSQFVSWAKSKIGHSRDKHLLTVAEIISGFGFNPAEITRVSVASDDEWFYHNFGIRLDRVVNSTSAVATYAVPVTLTDASLGVDAEREKGV